MENIKAAIFDMDGVIIDSEPWHTLARARVFESFGIPKSTEKEIVLGARKSDYWSELNERYSLRRTTDELIKAEFDAILSLMKENGVRECTHLKDLLGFLKNRGVKAAVASSSIKKYVTGVLEYLGIESFFSAVVCGDEVLHPKPFPDIYLAAAEKLNASPKECFAVEDSRTGSLAAANAGIDCFGYRGTETAKNSDFSSCRYVVSDMLEIKNILSKI